MARQSRGRRPATGKHASSAARHRAAKRGPPSRSKATAPASDPIEHAIEILARELPALVATAVNRARKGKPATLLRTVHRMVKELDTMILARPEKPREHEALAALGPLTAQEAHLCLNSVELLRSIHRRQAAEPQPTLTPAQQQEWDDAQTQGNQLLQRGPSPQPPPPPPALWAGPERRLKHIPRSVFLGKHERRRP